MNLAKLPRKSLLQITVIPDTRGYQIRVNLGAWWLEFAGVEEVWLVWGLYSLPSNVDVRKHAGEFRVGDRRERLTSISDIEHFLRHEPERITRAQRACQCSRLGSKVHWLPRLVRCSIGPSSCPCCSSIRSNPVI